MRANYNIYLAYIIMVLFTVGCASSPKSGEDETTEQGNQIQITKQQFESENMKIGDVSLQLFEEEVVCNGFIASPPNGMAQISTQISGIVETINCSLGDYVKKGQVLCALTSTELIALQQEFAETSANLSRLKADYERSKNLFNEKIGAEKDFKAIENAYQITLAKYQSLKLRLEMLDLNPLKIEAGELYSSFPVLAPISGYITSHEIILGQFVEQQKKLIELVDANQLQLQLSVFENDISNVKVGQKIRFNLLGEPNSLFMATVTSLGKTIKAETKTITCLAKIEDHNAFHFINNSYVEAKISVNQMELKALPNEAILKSGPDYFVLVLDNSDAENYYLRKEKVEIGRKSMGYTEFISTKELTNVIIQGVYNLSVE